jgi:HAD superfamily hydrolase (TIGR01549 family)
VPITSVCFDWDGTLCDSGPCSLRAFRKSLADFGLSFTDEQYKRVYSPRWYLMYEALGLPNDHWRAADQRWLFHYRDEAPGLIPGTLDVLNSLAARGLPLGIVTNGTRSRVEKELVRFGLDRTFQAVMCCEDAVQKKPHPEGLHKAMALLGLPASECCYVGDTAEDIGMGRNAGALTVGIVTEYVDERRLRDSAPDILLQSLVELPAALQSCLDESIPA